MLRNWNELPRFMRTPEVFPYWKVLNEHRFELFLKRVFDVIASVTLLIITGIPMIIIAISIKCDSNGPVFYRQERVTAYGKIFRIHKFRTMVVDADKKGSAVTIQNDNRITKVGEKLRGYRLDELPQLIDVLVGNMSFVGTRPEVTQYVKRYKPEYFATLLLPAGITSEASIRFKDEDKLLDGTINIDETYIKKVLPQKMKWNLLFLERYSVYSEICTMIKTVVKVFGKD